MRDELLRKLEGATLHAIGQLIRAWDADAERPVHLIDRSGEGSVQLIWTLTNHATEATRTFVDLAANGRMLVAMPLFRISLECAATSRWLLVDATGAGAVFAEALRQHRVAAEAAVKRGVSEPRTVLDEDAEWARLTDLLRTKPGAQISERFKLIPGGDVMSAEYRRASGLSHAGLELANEYVNLMPATPDKAADLAFSPVNVLDGSGRWSLSALRTLIYAYETVDQIDAENRLRDAIEQASILAFAHAAAWADSD